MTRVVVTETARGNLANLTASRKLPPSTLERVRALLEPLGTYPLLGRSLQGRWSSFRVLIGPWPWMILIYQYDEDADLVAVITIQDARTAAAATHER